MEEIEECGHCGNEYPELLYGGAPICLECARNHGVEEECENG